ncbi:hypothetical protein SC171_21505 [Pantoea cypripedii]|uniref:hypothetical protein n=1 Tax=Pantoea cypripedii TaxID=55209 RepID=UPI002FC7C60B
MYGIHNTGITTPNLSPSDTDKGAAPIGEINTGNSSAQMMSHATPSGSTGTALVQDQRAITLETPVTNIQASGITETDKKNLIRDHLLRDTCWVLGHAGTGENAVVPPKSVFPQMLAKTLLAKLMGEAIFSHYLQGVKADSKLPDVSDEDFLNVLAELSQREKGNRTDGGTFLVISDRPEPADVETLKILRTRLEAQGIYVERRENGAYPAPEHCQVFSTLLNDLDIRIKGGVDISALLEHCELTLTSQPVVHDYLPELNLLQPAGRTMERQIPANADTRVLTAENPTAGTKIVDFCFKQISEDLPEAPQISFFPFIASAHTYHSEWLNAFTPLTDKKYDFTLANNEKIPCDFMGKEITVIDYDFPHDYPQGKLNADIRIFSIPIKSENQENVRAIVVSNLSEKLDAEAIQHLNTVMLAILEGKCRQKETTVEIYLPQVNVTTELDGHERERIHGYSERILICETSKEYNRLNIDHKGTTSAFSKFTFPSLSAGLPPAPRWLDKPFGLFYVNGPDVELVTMVSHPVASQITE